ncbi:EAL domain-containing protein [Erythrobacter sp. F6033]|uniref:putative bifunctional diguanylate cyclase/phosphodiesterase n=1 Tax=Erythrobacter sp. F6033 TaxID=2926401 RepID=UPI001FF4FBE1|nr:EAL domain-containing protein [Erythrobacter sp. F6033]MCK0128169.1 EAL domain-containing protein [Erythrobacter sp. F6033]
MSDGERLAMLDELEQSGLGWFWASDSEGNLTYLSGAIADRLEIPLEALIGKPLASVFVPVDGEGQTKSLALMHAARKAFSGIAVRAVDRSEGAVVRLAGQPVFKDGKHFSGFRGTGADITEEYHREAETARLAKFDSLTGLLNRHRMAQQIETTLTAFKTAKRDCAIMMLDLDKFKQVNDTLGHAAGDELLKQVAERLRRAIDKDCEIGRLGGDEFQVLLPDIDDRGVLGDIASKIITMLKQPYSLEEGRCVIGASVGIAIAPHDGVTCDEVVRSADLALYAAKNGGRGQYRFFSCDLENEAIFRRRLEADLGKAIREQELFLKYEPIVHAKTQEVCALEAHICWNHEQRGEIDEEEFALILEDSSRVIEVGKWAITQACEHAAEWPDTIRVAVNVPVPLFNHSDFVEYVAEALQTADMHAGRLELEVNEAVFFGDTNHVDRTLAQLFKLGVRLTLDEFGSGYSSLAYLRRAPFDAIKIDEKLLAEADRHDSRELSLVKAIVALSGALEMDTIANGIETNTLLASLLDCGVSFVEGPIFSDPVDKDTVEAELLGEGWTIQPCGDRTKRARRRTVYRKIHVIHADHSYEVTLRNLSKTGALIEGLSDVPKGTQFVVDLGGGQLAVATVIRAMSDNQGLEFEQPLVDDGSGGLCTRNRVSPYALASAGAPLAALAPGSYKGMEGGMLDQSASMPKFGYASSTVNEAA